MSAQNEHKKMPSRLRTFYYFFSVSYFFIRTYIDDVCLNAIYILCHFFRSIGCIDIEYII